MLVIATIAEELELLNEDEELLNGNDELLFDREEILEDADVLTHPEAVVQGTLAAELATDDDIELLLLFDEATSDCEELVTLDCALKELTACALEEASPFP